MCQSSESAYKLLLFYFQLFAESVNRRLVIKTAPECWILGFILFQIQIGRNCVINSDIFLLKRSGFANLHFAH